MPTLEGQYVLKDLILAATMVIATTAPGGLRRAITESSNPSRKDT